MLEETGGGIFANLFKDPMLFSIIAGELGQSMSDPGTLGKEMGLTAADLARSMKLAGERETTKLADKEFRDTLLKLLSGGFSPAEAMGPTSMKMSGDKMTLDITPPADFGLGIPTPMGEAKGVKPGARPGAGADVSSMLKDILGPF